MWRVPQKDADRMENSADLGQTVPVGESVLGLHYLLSGGRTGLMVRASDSGSGDPGSILGRVGVFVSLSKRHLLPKSTGNTQE